MSEKEDGCLGMMLFQLQRFPQSGNAEVGDLAGKNARDFFESVTVGIRFDDRENIGLSGSFLKGLEIFEKTIRAKFNP